jgi:ActR/RegA family two-component response regulator
MLRSLLVSHDEKTVHTVGRVFKDLEVEFEHCSDAGVALEILAKHRYDAVVLDDQIDDASGLLERVLQLPTCNKAVRIFLAEPVAEMHAVFKTGTQVILYKPLSPDRVRHGLRAVRNLMARERRRGSGRVPTTIGARIRHRKGSAIQVSIADLSDSGAAIQCPNGPLPYSGSLQLDFALPGDSDRIQLTAELVWQNNEGAGGIRFLDMASHARKKLGRWLKEELAEKGGRTTAARAGE